METTRKEQFPEVIRHLNIRTPISGAEFTFSFLNSHIHGIKRVQDFPINFEASMADAGDRSRFQLTNPSKVSSSINPSAEITGFRDLASYTWLNQPNLNILVPGDFSWPGWSYFTRLRLIKLHLGTPPLWNPPQVQPKLEAEVGTPFVDQNISRYSRFPLEPLIRSVLQVHPKFDLDAIDVITDRSPLRKLFETARDEFGVRREDFKFGVHVIGKTALFVETMEQTRNETPPSQFRGHRWAFQDAYTKVESSAKESRSHYRIVEYYFGGLRLLVRSGVDAYLKDIASIPTQEIEPKDESEEEDKSNKESAKATALGSAAPPSNKRPRVPGLLVVDGGCDIPHAAVAEFTTCAKSPNNRVAFREKMPDLWISQTPNYIKARYEPIEKWKQVTSSRSVVFDFNVVSPMREDMATWQTENARSISRLVIILRWVVDTARNLDAPVIVSYEPGYTRRQDTISIYKADRNMQLVLPEDLQKKWLAGGAETPDPQKPEI